MNPGELSSAWNLFRTMAERLPEKVEARPESWHAVFQLPHPSGPSGNPWRIACSGQGCLFIMEDDPKSLAETIQEAAGPGASLVIHAWDGRLPQESRLSTLGDEATCPGGSRLSPQQEWGWPAGSGRRVFASLLIPPAPGRSRPNNSPEPI